MSDGRILPILRGIILDSIPLLTVIVLILMTVMPHTLPPMTRVGGLWPLTGISFWTLARPRNMRLPLVFVLGVLVDIAAFVPLGVHASIFVVSQAVLRRQRRYLLGQGFWMLWSAFALLALCVYSALFVMMSVFVPSAVGFTHGLVGVGVAWACLPLVVWALAATHETIDLFDDPVA